MGKYDEIGMSFGETMSGWIGEGYEDPVDGRVGGEIEKTPIVMTMKITIDCLSKFIDLSDHAAGLTGTFTYSPIGKDLEIENGVFNLFNIDPSTGRRHMIYRCNVKNEAGEVFHLHGHKDIFDDPGFDVLDDMTTMFTTIYRGTDDEGLIFGAGQLFFKLSDAPSLFASLEVIGDAWWGQRIAAKMAFINFAYGALRDEYLRDVSFFYDSGYHNLVLSGKTQGDGREFFFVSGTHEKDFPWGDGELFTDVLLVVGDGSGGWRRFGITERVIENLQLDVRNGSFKYVGDIYEIVSGYSVAFTELDEADSVVVKRQTSIELSFEARAFGLTPFPFRILGDTFDRLSLRVRETLRKLLPSEHLLGIHIIPHAVKLSSGSISISGDDAIDVKLDGDATFGEAEISTLKNVKEPTLLYGYVCGIRPQDKEARVQIHANSYRNDRPYWGKDRIDAFIGAVVSHLSHKEYLVAEDGLTVKDLGEGDDGPATQDQLFERIGEPIAELVNDQYPTADFIRRIIKVDDPSGQTCLALEEDMDGIRREAINVEPGTPPVKVASIWNKHSKIEALDEVLAKTDFFDVLDKKRQEKGKELSDFHVVIKPNFMFTYNKRDRTTFTDPDLVKHLIIQLKNKGYSKVTIVEAQSTYGQYFNNRKVRDVAEYIGYEMTGADGYDIVDLTLDIDEDDHRDFGQHLGRHPVAKTWRDADFRISFAKNKTHCYAYYTLTLKNIYGALPMANKFKEYHCDRGIYRPTIEYLQMFPVDFGLIDAYESADGPFGIFADSEPNVTKTIIGGPNIIAVDWIGASKMGIDPKISKYMDLAIRTFGKPEIDLIGNASLYRPWLNVPMALTLFAHFGIDANFTVGNIFYMAGCFMDESHFTHKSRAQYMRLARRALKPIQEMVFLQAGGERTRANRAMSRFLTWLGR